MSKVKLAILSSGEGSTGEVLFEKAAVVVTNKPDAGVIERAKKYGLPCVVLPRSGYRVYSKEGEVDKDKSLEKYGKALLDVFKKYQVNYISQNGWSVLTPGNVVKKFKGRIVNSHPAPLDPGYPDFGGVGMHGLAVHAAVVYFAKKVARKFKSEVTLHLVNEEYDKGELLAYQSVDIKRGDTPETLQGRIKKLEKRQLKNFWDWVEEKGKITPIKRLRRIIRPKEKKILEQAKKYGTSKYPKG